MIKSLTIQIVMEEENPHGTICNEEIEELWKEFIENAIDTEYSSVEVLCEDVR